MRAVEAAGGHAMVLRKGDPDRGALVIFLVSRGTPAGCFERILDVDGDYLWRESGPLVLTDFEKVSDFLAKRARFDADLWAIELDIADPERFIAENLRAG